jgi:alkylation response protein AidB-like acyl-CoA dehydrogenase
MDLRYSRADEAFRAEIRAWLAVEVAAHGSPPPSDDWPTRRAYDTAWQRKLYDAGLAGLAWPSGFGGRGMPITQQLVYLEEYARAGAPYIGVNFVGLMHAGPTLIAEGPPH